VTGQQRAELFIGGLPDHIRVDVELQAPQDLQTAMHYARAYERRAQAVQQAPLACGGRAARPPPTVAAATRPAPPGPAGPAPRLLARSAASPRRSSSNAAALGSASTATTPIRPATCARASSTWRQSTWRRETRRPGRLPRPSGRADRRGLRRLSTRTRRHPPRADDAATGHDTWRDPGGAAGHGLHAQLPPRRHYALPRATADRRGSPPRDRGQR
jgi:hypothetical protein